MSYSVAYGADYTRIDQWDAFSYRLVRTIIIPRSEYRNPDFYNYNGGRMTTAQY